MRDHKSIFKHLSPPTSSVSLQQYGILLAAVGLGGILLDGYVQRSGDRIRVTVQLISIADGKHLWSGQFNDDYTGIFGVEDSISEQMLQALRLSLTDDEQRRVTRHYTENAEAYQLYLKGRYFQDKMTTEGLKKSIDYFQQTTELDPKYAQAFAGLAESYVLLAVHLICLFRFSKRQRPLDRFDRVDYHAELTPRWTPGSLV